MTTVEILKVVRECEDLLVEVKKVISVFDADENWHKNYDHPTKERVDQFNHLNLDPRIIAHRGLVSVESMQDKLSNTWYTLMEELRGKGNLQQATKDVGTEGDVIAALFVVKDGPYSNLPNVDAWPEERDARKYAGPHPVVAHSPCQRWGRYWSGGPSAVVRRVLGDDNGCFESALKSVRTYGGVLEHPEASHAFKKFGLPLPAWKGGWSEPDIFDGRSCCVSQGHYGHPARKMTWLYAVGIEYPELIWGPAKNKMRLDLGYHSAEERRRAIGTGIRQRLSHRQRLLTPEEFRDLLIEMARSVKNRSET